MKKFLSLVAVMAVAVMASSTVWAADILPATQTAHVTFASTDVSVSFDLYTHQDGKAYTFSGEDENPNYTTKATDIGFDVSNVQLGDQDGNYFAKGTVFARVKTNIAQKNAGTTIYMYTKNTTTDNHDYQTKYTDSSHNMGLIRKTNTSTYAKGDNAPLEMQFFVKSAAPTTYPTSMSQDANAGNEKYIEDTQSSSYSATTSKIGQSGLNGGIWCGTNQYGDYYGSDAIIFFGAWFSTVFEGDDFGTESITIATNVE